MGCEAHQPLEPHRLLPVGAIYDGLFDRYIAVLRWRRAMQVLALQPGECVLLVGVGTRADLPLLPEDVRAIGLDLSPKRRSSMISIESKVRVASISGTQLVDFMLNCTDLQYQAWWPGTHLAFHTVESRPGYVGNVVSMDEYVGKRRVKMGAIVTEVVSGKKVVWQFKKVLRLPARLILEVDDDAGGVAITHTIQAGFQGVGNLLDPFFRLYFSASFERAMEQHAQTEFPMLGAMLSDSIQS